MTKKLLSAVTVLAVAAALLVPAAQFDAAQVSAATYAETLAQQGFPESYIPLLKKLHKAHPNWIFIPQKTNLKWSDVLEKEYVIGENVIEPSWPNSWKAVNADTYNFSGNYYLTFDGRWHQASKKIIKFYMDPRNGLNDDKIFEFLTHKFDSKTQTKSTMKSLTSSVSGCFMNTKEYREGIYTAGKTLGVNPNVLIAMIISEQGWSGKTNLISGKYKAKVYDPKKGKKVSVLGYYNFFNFGAYSHDGNNATENGLLYAKKMGWDTIEKSIAGGAESYAKGYVKKSQFTSYTKKFNVAGGNVDIYHQYSTALAHAVSEGSILQRAYKKNDDYALKFYIPIYKGLPDKPCVLPGKSGDNDNYLNSLKIADCKISPSFSRFTKTYKATAANDVESIKVTAKAHNSKAKITGKGTHSLNVGKNTIKVKVKSTSGVTRTYKINITRKSK